MAMGLKTLSMQGLRRGEIFKYLANWGEGESFRVTCRLDAAIPKRK
jgi:hypothetical protein